METNPSRNSIFALFAAFSALALLAGGCSSGEDELKAADERLEKRLAAAEKRMEALAKRLERIEEADPVGQQQFQAMTKMFSSYDTVDRELKARLDALEAELFHKPQLENIKALYPDAAATESGLHYLVEAEGDGEATPSRGDTVVAHYEGALLDGTVFDSSRERGEPFRFQVGMGRVIKGWDEAFLDMKKGEKRKLIIPSKLAYGSREIPGSIPARSVLVFDVELLDWEE